MLIMLAISSQANEWWRNPELNLNWQQFNALPALNNPNGFAWYWDIQERCGNGTPKFFAQSVLWDSPTPGETLYNNKLLVSDPSSTPTFIEIPIDKKFVNGFSTILSKWNKPHEELFLGTNTGLWRLNEDGNQLVCEWPWGWDPVYQIVSLGTSIFGRVTSWGSQSGYHHWKPDGTHIYEPFGGTSEIWGDPITGNHGNGFYQSRITSKKESLTVGKYYLSGYSLDGLSTALQKPIGTSLYGENICVSSFYCYADKTIIIKTSHPMSEKLCIGKLGGTFYPLNPPIETGATLFYSPSTRLLVTGDATSNQLYYVVLPAPDPEPQVHISVPKNESLFSWNIQDKPVTVQTTTDLATWQTITLPQTTTGVRTEVVVPGADLKKFFRLAIP